MYARHVGRRQKGLFVLEGLGASEALEQAPTIHEGAHQ